LVKYEGFEDEQEWRLTIPEHYPSSSPSQLAALAKAEGYEFFAKGQALMTVDVQFRQGGPAVFKPYTTLSFEKSALFEQPAMSILR
jgi:hypothetical protein